MLEKYLKLLVCLCVCHSLVLSEQREFSISSDFSECETAYNQSSVVTEYADFKFNDETNELQIDVSFSNSGGTLANGFHFGFNSEGSLSTNFYKLPYFYVDGRLGAGIPKVNAFLFNRHLQSASNCNNNPGSWDTNAIANKLTEAILPGTSGYGGNPAWIKFASLVQSTSGGVTKNTFSLILDAAALGAFTPNSTDAYLQSVGIQCYRNGGWTSQCPQHNLTTRIFDFAGSHNSKKLTMDFVPVNITTSSYNGSGQLTAFTTSSCSLCRFTEEKTNIAPTCSSVTSNTDVVRSGEAVEVEFEFSDPDIADSHKVEFYNVPSGATVSPGSDDTLSPGEDKVGTLAWTPGDQDVGQTFNISASLTQLYGHNNSSSTPSECSTEISVIARIQPVCEVKDLSQPLSQAISKTKQVKNLLNKANKILVKHEKKLKIKKKTNFSTRIKSTTADLLGELEVVPTAFNTCSERYGACTQVDYFDEYTRYINGVLKLYCDGKVLDNCNFIENIGHKLLKLLQKRHAKYLMKFKKKDKKTAKKMARNLVKKKYQAKLLRLVSQNYDSVRSLIDGGETIHFICEGA